MEKKSSKTIFEIIELSKTKLNDATVKVKEIKKISFDECKYLISESLVPMSVERRQLFYDLSNKISAKELLNNFDSLLVQLKKKPRSLRFIARLLEKVKHISYENCLICLSCSIGTADLKLIYFFYNLATRCLSTELSQHLKDLLILMDKEPQLYEVIRALIKTIPAKNIPKPEILQEIFKPFKLKQVWELKILLLRRKTLGDKKFILRGFSRVVINSKLSSKIRLCNGNLVKAYFSSHELNRGGLSFKDILTTPCGPAIVISYEHGALLITPVGEYGAFYLDGVALKDFRDCGIRRIGKI